MESHIIFGEMWDQVSNLLEQFYAKQSKFLLFIPALHLY